MKHFALSLFVGALLLIFPIGAPPTANAATTQVGCDTADLIAAINNANLAVTTPTLDLPDGCLYPLKDIDNAGYRGDNGLPQIARDMIINGHGATIQRQTFVATTSAANSFVPQAQGPEFRVFQVNQGATLTLNNITLRNGLVNELPENEKGGTILVLGTLNLSDSAIHNGIAGCGGGIWSEGTLAIVNTTFANNIGDN